MSSLRSIDLRFIDDLVEFVRGKGYVLDFSDITFAEFFEAEIGVDIDDPVFSARGSSKGKRFRYFLQTTDDASAARTLRAIWEHREDYLQRAGIDDPTPRSRERFDRILSVLAKVDDTAPRARSREMNSLNSATLEQLKGELLELHSLQPQERGYKFEKWLKALFSENGLAANDPFRMRGDQIDGSFQLANETYLLEAKWQNSQVGAAELHTFHGKIEQRAAWTRGLFVSYSGFTEPGLIAFGRGKRVICMDGLDIHDMLSKKLSIATVLEAKVRRAAETGSPFTPVRDLFN